MTFAHPWLLLGLLAALIPLLVHLFDRRRPRLVPFGALMFVLRSQKRTASRLKLKRLLLYLLRTLLFIVVPLAAAMPSCVDDTKARAAQGAASTAIVVDVSLVTRFRHDGKPLLDEARRQARDAVAQLRADEPVTVLACPSTSAPAAPHFDKVRAISAIDELVATAQPADLNRCLDAAARALDDSPQPNRRLVVVSPFTSAALRLEVPAPAVRGPQGAPLKPQVVLRGVAADTPLPNRAIVDVKAEAAPQAGPKAWQFTVTVRNFSDEAQADVPVELRVGGAAVVKGFVDVAAHATAQKALTHRFTQAGLTPVTAALPGDGLADDDVRELLVPVPRDARVLVVDGAPSPNKYKDEAYFVAAALSAAGSPVAPVLRDTEAAWREDFATYDALALLNVEAPPDEVAARLLKFVTSGGGLLIAMGDRVDPDEWNKRAAPLLPRPFRVVKTAVEPTAPEAQTQAARVDTLSTSHPVLAPFSGEAREGLLAMRVYRYALFESTGAAEDVLSTLNDGAPLLLAQRKGKGRVVAFATSLDRDWSDAPVRTAFLPLVQRTAAWLTASLDEREAAKGRVGDTLTLTVPDGRQVGDVSGPSGQSAPVRANGGTATVGPLSEPGVYAVLDTSGKPLPELAFAVALDPLASDTERHAAQSVRAWFGEDVVLAQGDVGRGADAPVWTWLLVVAVLAFFLEGVLLRS